LPKDSQFLIRYAARAKYAGHHPFKKVIGQNIKFFSKILREVNYTFLRFDVLYGEIHKPYYLIECSV
jgi:hypothetical protein